MQCQLFRGLFRSHLDYVDIICDNPNNINICNKIEIIQYNASLTITPQTQDVSWTYIRRSEDVPDVFWTSYIRSIYVQCLRVIKLSKEKLYQELGFEYLSSRRWLRKRCLFYKAVVSKSPNYLYNYVSTVNQSYQTRSGDKFLHMCWKTEYFVNSFFLYPIKGWNNLSPEIRKSVSYELFNKTSLKLIRPPNSLFNVSDILGIKLLTRLPLGLSHLREHKFNHNFQDTINPSCSCS